MKKLTLLLEKIIPYKYFLKLYDILGREVSRLVNEFKAAGEYTIDFNADRLSSGVYFYRMETSGFSDIKKMMLLK